MRSTVWKSLLFVGLTHSQETVTLCESYLVTGISTFTEYTTYYVTDAAIGGSRPSTTIGDSIISMRTSTSSSSSLTSGNSGGSRSSSTMTMTTSKSVLIPDDNSDPVTPTTPIPTSSVTTTGSATIGTTNPTATSGTFVVAFNVPESAAGEPVYAYLAFDDSSHSKLVSNSTEAVPFFVVDGYLQSGSSYLAVDDDNEPTRFVLQDSMPSQPIEVRIQNGNVTLSGIDGYCLLGEQLVVIETGKEAPSECFAAVPQLIARSASTSSSSSASSGTSSSSDVSTTSDSVVSTTPVASTSSSASSSAPESASTSLTASTGSATTSSTSTSTESSSAASSSSSTSTTTLSSEPVVTNKAYIDTVLRHHNRHRANHTANPLTWSDSLAATAKKIADTCVYGHVVDTDCDTYPDYACYGQNIGAGYLPTQMGAIISDGFYNGEVNYYTYYGEEPDTNTLHQWGHFSQIVWKGSSSIGCYTTNCTASGLGKIDPSSGIRPYFTVCNYADPGNYLDEFADNVIKPLQCPTITANYGCSTDENCEDGIVGVNADLNVADLSLCADAGAGKV